MRWIAVLLIGVVLLGCEMEVEGFEEEEYGPNHALIQEAGLKFKADCMSCHGGGGFEEEGPTFRYAGTVWKSPNGDPAPGVKVILKAVGANDSLILTTDSYGNLKTSSSLSTAKYSAYIDCNGKILSMRLHPYHGGCNDCHRPGGKAGRVLSCGR
jgi:hypothetical protein